MGHSNALCIDSCGNGQVETCDAVYMQSSHCTLYYPWHEVCDGAVSCTTLGYFGGTATCASCMALDDAPCDPCAPGDAACKSATFTRAPGFSVSGSTIAQVGAGSIRIFNGDLTPSSFAFLDASSITATPTGWLVTTGAGIWAVASDGTHGPAQPSFAADAVIGPGPSGRYLVTSHGGAGDQIRAALVDATGATVIGPFDVMIGDGTAVALASDGLHGLVGNNGKVALVSGDGSVAIAPGVFASGIASNRAIVTHANTTSWYVYGRSGMGWEARAFDLGGAPLGMPIQIPATASCFLADGGDLLAAQEHGSATQAGAIELVRIRVDGTSGSTVVGAAKAGQVELDHLAADVIVSWSNQTNGMNLARVAPP